MSCIRQTNRPHPAPTEKARAVVQHDNFCKVQLFPGETISTYVGSKCHGELLNGRARRNGRKGISNDRRPIAAKVNNEGAESGASDVTAQRTPEIYHREVSQSKCIPQRTIG